MAKKNYQNAQVWDVTVWSDGSDKSTMVIKGRNSKGTMVDIKVTMEDYLFPHIIKQMTNVVKKKLSMAEERLAAVKNAAQ